MITRTPLLYYKQSLSLFREMGLTGKVVQILHNIGQLELDRENFMEAEGFFKSSLVLELRNQEQAYDCLVPGRAGLRDVRPVPPG